MAKRKKPDAKLKGMLNHYALLKHDADYLTSISKNPHGSFEGTIIARSAILLYIISLEVLMNRVIEDFWPKSIPKFIKDDAKMWKTIHKWERIPEIISGKKFRKNSRPFQYLKPLILARNDYVHAKSSTFQVNLDLYINNKTKSKEIRYPKSHKEYEQIHLLTDPSAWKPDEAEKVKTCCDELISELDKLLDGKLTKNNWLTTDILKSSNGQTIQIQRRYKPPSSDEETVPYDC